MRVYFDICCLKRPFDDQSQPRIALETAAVVALLKAVESGHIQSCRSVAHDLENSQNPVPRRAAAVQAWLQGQNPITPASPEANRRALALNRQGLGEFDAFHLALAEQFGCEVLATTDDDFQRRSAHLVDTIKVRVMGPISLVRELEL